MVLLEQHTASSSATLDFTSFISSTYDEYLFEFVRVAPANNGDGFFLQMGTGGGPTWDTGANYQYSNWLAILNAQAPNGSNTASGIGMPFLGVATGGTSGWMRLFDPQSSTGEKYVVGTTCNRQTTNGNSLAVWSNAGIYGPTTALTGIRFYFSTGNIASGTIRVYGVAK